MNVERKLIICLPQREREGASVQQAAPAASTAPLRGAGLESVDGRVGGDGGGVFVAPTRGHGPWKSGGHRDGESPHDAGRPGAPGRPARDRPRRGRRAVDHDPERRLHRQKDQEPAQSESHLDRPAAQARARPPRTPVACRRFAQEPPRQRRRLHHQPTATQIHGVPPWQGEPAFRQGEWSLPLLNLPLNLFFEPLVYEPNRANIVVVFLFSFFISLSRNSIVFSIDFLLTRGLRAFDRDTSHGDDRLHGFRLSTKFYLLFLSLFFFSKPLRKLGKTWITLNARFVGIYFNITWEDWESGEESDVCRIGCRSILDSVIGKRREEGERDKKRERESNGCVENAWVYLSYVFISFPRKHIIRSRVL